MTKTNKMITIDSDLAEILKTRPDINLSAISTAALKAILFLNQSEQERVDFLQKKMNLLRKDYEEYLFLESELNKITELKRQKDKAILQKYQDLKRDSILKSDIIDETND